MQDKNITLTGVMRDSIPRIIGKGGMGMKKNVVFPSWNMYEEHIKDKNIEEQKPKLFVGISESEGNVVATIKTESSIMRKFAEYNLKNYVEKIIKSKRSDISTYTVLAILPHIRTPQIIGRGGSTIKKLKSDSALIFKEDELNYLAIKSFIQINPYEYDSITDLCKKVREDETMGFMGWEPDEDDTDEYISIKISSKLKGDDFEKFVDEFKCNVNDKIRSIVDFHSKVMNDISEALETDEE